MYSDRRVDRRYTEVSPRVINILYNRGISIWKTWKVRPSSKLWVCKGANVDVQIPTFVIDPKVVGVMNALYRTCRVAHLRFCNMLWEFYFMVCRWEKMFGFGIVLEILWLREKLTELLRACRKWFGLTSKVFRSDHIYGIILQIIPMIFRIGRDHIQMKSGLSRGHRNKREKCFWTRQGSVPKQDTEVLVGWATHAQKEPARIAHMGQSVMPKGPSAPFLGKALELGFGGLAHIWQPT
jgi:hypothetical protein